MDTIQRKGFEEQHAQRLLDAGVLANELKNLLEKSKKDILDNEQAQRVSESIRCGENLDEAIAKRDLEGILNSVDTIKTKGFEKDHAQRLLEADKLANKLKRLEKSKKEILALDQRTISEIRSYKKPVPAIQDVMTATYIILGYNENKLKVSFGFSLVFLSY